VSLGPGTPPAVPASRVIAVSSGWSGSAVILLSGVTSTSISGIAIDCSALSGSVNGVGMTGVCYDVHLEDVYVNQAPADGIVTSGYHFRFDRVTSVNAGNFGANVTNATDSTFANCLMFGSDKANWALGNNANCIFSACRAEWSATGDGWYFSGSTGTCVLPAG
jgi:hypothetical protein